MSHNNEFSLAPDSEHRAGREQSPRGWQHVTWEHLTTPTAKLRVQCYCTFMTLKTKSQDMGTIYLLIER